MGKILLKISLIVLHFLVALKADFNAEQCSLSDYMSNKRKQNLETLVQWIRQQGGKFNPKVEITFISDDNSFPRIGMIAKEGIDENEMIFDIPSQCFFTIGLPDINDDVLVHQGRRATITSINSDFSFDVEFEDYDDEEDIEKKNLHLNRIFKLNGDNIICDVINNLVEEMKQGNSSQFAPFVNFLRDEISGKKSPNHWSEQGKALLQEILNDELPPYNVVSKSWNYKCQTMSNDEDSFSAVKLPNDLKHIIFPALDIINHANGNILNTKTIKFNRTEGFSIEASRKIKAGEEIYHSYNFDNYDNEKDVTYGTAALFRDYGFVEKYPQRWFFPKHNYLKFDLHQTLSENNNSTHENFHIRWINIGFEDDITKLNAQLQRLIKFKQSKLKGRSDLIPKKELSIIMQYLHSLLNALKHATTTERKVHCDDDDIDGDLYYHDIDYFRSPYQTIRFMHNPITQDTCFMINNRFQSCASYRPHYHEIFVHYPARFLNEVKRVVFVGGGDSMLLHEILMYPSLELVVGLEIDQFVVRKSFQYFGTQPHWDNEKVSYSCFNLT